MDILKSVILSIVQGLTEFLPVSSSGHLAIADAIFGNVTENLQTYIVVTHFGTMMATIWVFWDDIIDLFKSLGTIPKAIKEKQMNGKLKTVIYIIIASVPTGIVGVLLNDKFESFTHNLIVVGAMLLVTAVILLIPLFIPKREENPADENSFGFLRALGLGIAQSVAIMPGISRSGTTISTALAMKTERKFAGKISFLISLPAIAAAALLEWFKLAKSGCPFSSVGRLSVIIAFLVSFGVGLLALKVLLKIVEKGKFYLFSIYCFVLGITTIVLRLTKVI